MTYFCKTLFWWALGNPDRGGEGDTRLAPECNSGLFTLNHSVVSLGQGFGMDFADPMSFPHSGHRTFAGANPLRMTGGIDPESVTTINS